MFNKKKIARLEAENRVLKDLLNFYIALNELNLQLKKLNKVVARETIPIHLN